MYENLVTASTYARMKGVTTECVRQWTLQGKVKSVKIDNVRFIKLREAEVKKGQNYDTRNLCNKEV